MNSNPQKNPAEIPADPWTRVEISTDPLGDTITQGTDETGTFVVLEVLDAGDSE